MYALLKLVSMCSFVAIAQQNIAGISYKADACINNESVMSIFLSIAII